MTRKNPRPLTEDEKSRVLSEWAEIPWGDPDNAKWYSDIRLEDELRWHCASRYAWAA
jgi:hypothetical protein